MNRDDLMRMAQKAKLFHEVDGCKDCFMRIPNLDGVERFAFIFFQAARAEMIKEGWRFGGDIEKAISAERKACLDLAEDLIRHFEDKKISQDPLGGTREIYAIRKYQDMIHARGEA